jgi:hypothetical protein
MNPMLSRTILVVCALLLTGAAQANDQRNAATWYARAIERVDVLTEADRAVIEQFRAAPEKGPPPGLRDALSRATPMINLVRRGARQEFSDYGLDYSQGFELLIPHLGPLRSLARVLHADALLLMHDGDTAGAAQRIAALYRLADHLGDDRTLISSLVGRAIFGIADGTTQIGFDRGVFSSHDAEVLLRSVRPMGHSDPFAMAEAVVMEREIATSWLRTAFGEEEDRARRWEEMGLYADDEQMVALADMTDDGFEASIQQYDETMGEMVEAFLDDDPEAGRAELDRIMEEIDAGEHGVMAQMIAPALGKVYDLMIGSRTVVNDRIEMLDGVVTGRLDPALEANAAYDYARGIEEMNRIDPARRALFAPGDAGRHGPVDEEIGLVLESAQAVVDHFRAGSERRRCDFGFLRDDRMLALCPAYVADMHAALRLIRLDARRLLAAGDTTAALDRLGICYRVVAHVSGDDPLVSALVAHDAFDRTDHVVRRALNGDAFDDTHRAALLDAAERVRMTDPFGYIGSVAATRKAVAGWMRNLAADAPPAPDGVDRPARISAAARLGDIIDRDGLEAARNEVASVAPILAHGEIPPAPSDVARFARVKTRMSEARADLRRGLALLRPTPSTD